MKYCNMPKVKEFPSLGRVLSKIHALGIWLMDNKHTTLSHLPEKCLKYMGKVTIHFPSLPMICPAIPKPLACEQ